MKYLKNIKYNSPVVLTFALVSFIALVLDFITNGLANRYFFSVYRSSPFSLAFWIRLVGHVLGHADLNHYTGNMFIILLLGPMLEEKHGSKRLLTMIGAVAVVTGAVNMILFPFTALLGASGIVFMMIIMSSAVSIKKGEIPMTLIVVTIIYIGQELVAGVVSRDNVSRLTHIIGGICGGVFGMLFSSKENDY